MLGQLCYRCKSLIQYWLSITPVFVKDGSAKSLCQIIGQSASSWAAALGTAIGTNLATIKLDLLATLFMQMNFGRVWG
jgi:hypothetical protein